MEKLRCGGKWKRAVGYYPFGHVRNTTTRKKKQIAEKQVV